MKVHSTTPELGGDLFGNAGKERSENGTFRRRKKADRKSKI